MSADNAPLMFPSSPIARFAEYLLQRVEATCQAGDVMHGVPHLAAEASAIRRQLESAPAAIVFDANSLPTDSSRRHARLSEFRDQLRRLSLREAFSGYASRTESTRQKDTLIAVVHGDGFVAPRRAPRSFHVVAFVCTYNEGDIITPLLRHLLRQGVEPYLIDNHSTDDTVAQAQHFLGRGLRGIERFPADGPSATYEWQKMLRRVETLAEQIDADWFMLNDADEFRQAPDRSATIRDALFGADALGFNCVDLTILNFHPTDDTFRPGASPERSMRYFEFPESDVYYFERKTWKNMGQRVDLAGVGGHDVSFPGRRIYPYKFLSKHYPIRSQRHGERKVFTERLSRFSEYEKNALGWHFHYDELSRSHSFLRDPADLLEFDGNFDQEYLVERLSGIGARPYIIRGDKWL